MLTSKIFLKANGNIGQRFVRLGAGANFISSGVGGRSVAEKLGRLTSLIRSSG